MPLEIPTQPHPSMDLISVDDHIIEPPNVWVDRAPAKYKDRAPRVVPSDDGSEMWTYEDRAVPNSGLQALAGRKFEEYTAKAFSFKEMRAGCYDAKERLADMDLDGVLIQMCFPQVPGIDGTAFLSLPDVEYRDWLITSYNDWLVDEFQAADPKRLLAHGVLPIIEPEKAVAELERIVRRGIKSITVSGWIEESVPGAQPIVHEMYDPIWSACEEMGIPVNMHIGGGGGRAGDIFASGIPGLPEAFIHGAQLTNFQVLAKIIWTGMLDRHPELKVVSTEGGIGWIPYFLEWGDHVYDRHRHWAKSKIEKPSFYFHRQCYAAFLDDPAGVALRHTIGVDSLLWESDYQHSDTTWPFSHDRVNDHMATIPEDGRRKIVWENAVKLFKLDVD